MPLPLAPRLSVDEVPVIAVSALRGIDPAERRALARRVADACRGLGFFYVTDHGIDPGLMDQQFVLARRFFALPAAAKEEISMARRDDFRGWLPARMVGGDPAIKGNLHESFHVFSEYGPDDPAVLAGQPLHGVNLWPPAMPEFREPSLRYFDAVGVLALQLLELFALGLDMPEDTFTRHFGRPMHQMKYMFYPPQEPTDPGDELGVRPHTDPGGPTLLVQDDVGGLEVLARSGDWIAVPPIEHAFVVNIGEMMKIWTDGIFTATPHRVINRYGRERYSLPFIASPDYDALIEPLVHNPDAEAEPWFGTSERRGQAITCGAILDRLYGRIWPTASG